MDSSPESEDVSQEEFEASFEDSLVVFLELELLEQRLFLALFFLGCLFLARGALFCRVLEGLE